jgi:hypothetical protein
MVGLLGRCDDHVERHVAAVQLVAAAALLARIDATGRETGHHGPAERFADSDQGSPRPRLS